MACFYILKRIQLVSLSLNFYELLKKLEEIKNLPTISFISEKLTKIVP